MAYQKKYQSYKIETTIESKTTSLSIIDYKTALNEYKFAKENCADKNAIVCFLGIKQDGQVDIIFRKEYVQKSEMNTIQNILESIKDNLDKLNSRKEYLANLQGICDKKRDVIFHDIENSGDVSKEEMVATYKKLQQVCLLRREVKHEYGVYTTLNLLKFSQSTLNMIEKANNTADKLETKKERFKQDKSTNLGIVEIPYQDHKQRIKLTAEMQKKYDKVGYDDSRSIVYGYNKAYAN